MFERAQISFVLANVFHIELVKVLLPILKLNVRLRLHDVNNTYSFRFNIVCVLTKDFSVSTHRAVESAHTAVGDPLFLIFVSFSCL